MSRGEKPLLEHSKSVLESSLADVDGGGVAYLEWGSLACSCTNRQFWSWVDWGERDVWVESCTKGFHYFYIIIINSDGDTRRTEAPDLKIEPQPDPEQRHFIFGHIQRKNCEPTDIQQWRECVNFGEEKAGTEWRQKERSMHSRSVSSY